MSDEKQPPPENPEGVPPKRPPPAKPIVPRPRPGQGAQPKVPGNMPSGALRGLPSTAVPAQTDQPKTPPPQKHSKHPYTISAIAVLLVATAYIGLTFVSRNKIIADGKTIHHYSFSKGTAGELLKQYQIEVASKDIVTPSLASRVRWGEKVQVVRVKETFEKKTELVDFVLKSKKRTTKNLRKVENQTGYRETKTWFLKHVFHDGNEVSTSDSPKIVHRTDVERLVLLDEREYPATTYDFTKCKKMSVIATAYWKGDPKVPGVVTYSGHKVQRGLVAVDPKTIPLGWRLYIPDYGYAYSSDTGSKIKGNRIDLFVENKKASRQWEYNRVTVYLLEKSPTW